MKLFHLCGFWLFCFFAPAFAGDWWDSSFNFWQSLVSLSLIAGILGCYRTWWARAFACVALLQIAINTADTLIGLQYATYNRAQSILNGLEFLLLFGVGGITELRRAYDNVRDSSFIPDRHDYHG